MPDARPTDQSKCTPAGTGSVQQGIRSRPLDDLRAAATAFLEDCGPGIDAMESPRRYDRGIPASCSAEASCSRAARACALGHSNSPEKQNS